MRTTVNIDDEVLRFLKEEAARTGRTLGELIEDAVRAKQARPRVEPSDLTPLPTYGGSGVMPGVDISDLSSVRELMDEDAPLDALR